MEFILIYLFYYFYIGITFSISSFIILFTLNNEKALSLKDYIIILFFYPLIFNSLINKK
jgi:hypothetical protein